MRKNVTPCATLMIQEDLRREREEHQTYRLLEGVYREQVCRLHTTNPERYANLLGIAEENGNQARMSAQRIAHLEAQIKRLS